MVTVRTLLASVFTPAARRMSRVNPNALTLVSVASGVAAGVSFALAARGGAWYAAAGLLVAASGSADSLDGIVARLHERTSKAGEFLDHAGDRLVEVCILAGIAASPGANTVLGLGVVILTLLNSGIGTQIEATFGHRAYSGLGKAEQFIGLVVFAFVLAIDPDFAIGAGGFRVTAANLLFALLAAGTLAGLVHRLRLALALAAGAGDPAAAADEATGAGDPVARPDVPRSEGPR